MDLYHAKGTLFIAKRMPFVPLTKQGQVSLKDASLESMHRQVHSIRKCNLLHFVHTM